MVIMHAMGEYIGNQYAPDFLDSIKLSAHVLVTPSGSIIKCREDTEVAWHAKGFNSNSLGVEFLVPGHHDYGTFLDTIAQPGWLTPEQFDAGVNLVAAWAYKYGLNGDQLVRHSDIDPDRKKDPGAGFPWEELRSKVL